MTFRQFILKLVYPLLMLFAKKSAGNGVQLINEKSVSPPISFYSLSATTPSGKDLSFSDFKGKYIILCNTASDCGYTAQFEALQNLHEQFSDRLIILGFPANDFKNQEMKNDEQIAQFCSLNYGVTFPIMKKSSVIPGDNQHPVFQWLTKKELNGWNDHHSDWNFSKFLISPDGVLLGYFGPAIEPSDVVAFAQLK